MKKFKRIYIEITNVCNMNCFFCPPTARTPGFMDEETFTKVLDNIKGFSDYLFFHVKGEPLLHPLIGRFLDISHDKKFMVNLTTNGTLIDRARDRLLNKPALRLVSFSLHNMEKQAEPAMKTRYLDNIASFIRDALVQGLMIEFKLWNLDGNTADDGNGVMLDYLRGRLGLDWEVRENITLPGRYRLSDRLFLNIAGRFAWPDINSCENSPGGFCYALRTQAAILVDGTVVPCCLDGEGIIRLGNIHDSPFTAIINSDQAQNIKLGFSNRIAVEEMCRKCTYRNRFNISSA